MKNIRDLKCNAIRLDLDSNIASQEIAINMIADYQELWDCSVKDAIVHLLCDYHKLLENSTINTQYISHNKEFVNISDKSVTPDKFQENKEEPASVMEKEKINLKEENTKEEDLSANDPWAEIIAKNGFQK